MVSVRGWARRHARPPQCRQCRERLPAPAPAHQPPALLRAAPRPLAALKPVSHALDEMDEMPRPERLRMQQLLHLLDRPAAFEGLAVLLEQLER